MQLVVAIAIEADELLKMLQQQINDTLSLLSVSFNLSDSFVTPGESSDDDLDKMLALLVVASEWIYVFRGDLLDVL